MTGHKSNVSGCSCGGDIMIAKPKGFKEILEEDPKLNKKISYEEYRKNNDIRGSVKKAYDTYQKALKGE